MCANLEAFDGLLAPGAEHDAVVEAGDGPGAAGQHRQGWGGAHPCHAIGHCGEITLLIDSLAFIVIVLEIGHICQGVGVWRGK